MSIHDKIAEAARSPLIQKTVESKDAAKIRELLDRAAKSPSAQLAIAAGMLDFISDKRGRSERQISHSITMSQIERLARFGDKAYPLSERQLAALIEDICDH